RDPAETSTISLAITRAKLGRKCGSQRLYAGQPTRRGTESYCVPALRMRKKCSAAKQEKSNMANTSGSQNQEKGGQSGSSKQGNQGGSQNQGNQGSQSGPGKGGQHSG